ncbi:hypothetical protein GCM10010197_01830 [Nocardioides luteus]|uniref:DUF2207 domain-containing protein n=1 Tax=Nocardioides luteus TaxID=1844 RepID=A0ABQ5T0Z6_9ACTN|nr:hypothetical protein GCM10010197_01830 [Nocardioides luteus]GLJ69407.1 hypothetical protein GCM10017579_34430 [Nocardioides luteus]
MGYVIGVLVLAGLVLWPLAAAQVGLGDGEEVAEGTTITDYRGEFVVDELGRMRVTETVTVDFPDSESHGIYRFFDSRDPNAPGLRRVPEAVEVEVDPQLTLDQRLDLARERSSLFEDDLADLIAQYGEEEGKLRAAERYSPSFDDTEITRRGWSGRYTTLRIGDEYNRLPAGEHVYVIEYEVPDVLLPDADGSRFYWNLVPSGWRQPIEKASLSVTLPASSRDVRCAVGTGAPGGCASVSGEGSTELQIATGALEPGTPVTLRAGVDMAAPLVTADELPWSQEWDAVLGTDRTLAAVILALALGLAVPAVCVLVRARDPLPQAQPRTIAPEGVGPAQAAYLLSKRATPNLLASSVLYAASRGVVALRSTNNGWRVAVDTDLSWDGVDPVTTKVRSIGGGAIGARKKTKAAKRSARKLYDAQIKTRNGLREWAIGEKLLEEAVDPFLCRLGFTFAVIAAVVLAFLRPNDTTLWVLVPGLFAVLVLPMLPPGAGLRRTAAGRDLAAQVAGFRQSLRERADDFQSDQARYDSALPWAVAFGLTREWSRRFRVASGVATVAVPAYLPYDQHTLNRHLTATDGDGLGLVSALTSDFERSVGSAIRSYEASSAFSSGGSSSSGGGFSYSGGGGGGGGGFSGGGGGGDGGGGSW